MKHKLKNGLSLLLAVALLTGCSAAGGAQTTPEESYPDTTAAETAALTETSTMTETAQSEPITVSEIRSSGEQPGADEQSLTLDDSVGSIRITEAGTYRLSGTLTNGQIVVEAAEDAKLKLILDGVSIRCEGGAAIYAVSADKLVLATAQESSNLLESVGSFQQIDEAKVDAAVFARCDLTLSGDGELGIRCDSGHGVVSKDDLKIKSGTIAIEASGQGLSGKDSVTVEDGLLTIVSGTDGIQSEHDDTEKGNIEIQGGSIYIQSGTDGMEASGSVFLSGGELTIDCEDDGVHAENELTISEGLIRVTKCCEGLEAQIITIDGGEIRIFATDDGLNAAGGSDSSETWGPWGGDPFQTDSGAALTINGGFLVINAEGDGLDSNGQLVVNGGVVYVSGPTNGGNGAIDYGVEAVINGGTVIAAGSAGMAEGFGSSSTQGSMLLNVGNQSGGTTVTVTDESGAVLASYTPEKSYQTVVVSAPGMVLGGSYTVTAGSFSETVTIDSIAYGSGMGGFGGFGGPGDFGGFGGPGSQDGGPGGPGRRP